MRTGLIVTDSARITCDKGHFSAVALDHGRVRQGDVGSIIPSTKPRTTCKFFDTRGKAYREISGYLTRGTDTRVVPGLKILSAVFSVTDPTNLTPGGGHFDYELVVTNEGGAPIVLPQTLDWKEIDEEQASQNFVRAELYASMACLNNYSAVLDHLVFYGSDERPGTEIVLDPGDSARILGSGLMPLHLNMSCQSKGTATFLTSFQVYTMTLHRSPKPTMREGYSLEEEMFAVANGRKEYPITDSH